MNPGVLCLDARQATGLLVAPSPMGAKGFRHAETIQGETLSRASDFVRHSLAYTPRSNRTAQALYDGWLE